MFSCRVSLKPSGVIAVIPIVPLNLLFLPIPSSSLLQYRARRSFLFSFLPVARVSRINYVSVYAANFDARSLSSLPPPLPREDTTRINSRLPYIANCTFLRNNPYSRHLIFYCCTYIYILTNICVT